MKIEEAVDVKQLTDTPRLMNVMDTVVSTPLFGEAWLASLLRIFEFQTKWPQQGQEIKKHLLLIQQTDRLTD